MILKQDNTDSINEFINYIKQLTSKKIKSQHNINDIYFTIKMGSSDKPFFDSRTYKSGRISINTGCTVCLMHGNNLLNSGQISYMVNCCGIVIMHNATAGYSQAKKGFGKIGNYLRRFLCWNANFTIVIAQDKLPSFNINLLENSGWEFTREFVNKNSSNKVRIYSYNLRLFEEVDYKHLI